MARWSRWIAKALVWLAIALSVIGLLLVLLGGSTVAPWFGLGLTYEVWGAIALTTAVLAYVVGYAVDAGAAKEVLGVIGSAAKSVVSTVEDVVTSSTLFWLALAVGGLWLLSNGENHVVAEKNP